MLFLKIDKITLPKGLNVKITEKALHFFAENSNFSVDIHSFLKVSLDNSGYLCVGFFSLFTKLKNRELRACYPIKKTFIKKIEQIFFGFSTGYCFQLELVGVGYRAEILNDNLLVLKLGFSHDINITVPSNIKCFCPKETRLLFRSSCKDSLTSFVSKIQSYKKPDVYKNKGILYKGKPLSKKKLKKK